MKKTMKTALCGAGLVLLLAGVSAQAAVDGETYRVAGGEEWVQTGNYSGLTMGIWKDGAVPADGGTARLVTAGTIKLYPASGLQLGAIEVSSGVNATLTSRGLTMTGANPYIQVANNGTLVCESSTPVSGTGANTLLLKTAPGYGVGRIDLYAGASNFGLLDIESGAVNGYCTGVNQTMLTTGPVRLSGGYLSYVAKMASAGSASASIATGSGSTFTISPGPARLRVALRTNASDATLTVGPIVRDGRAYAEIDCSNESENGQTLGARTFVKTTQAPTLVNGIVEPWLVAKGEGADTLHDLDFLTYSADAGFFGPIDENASTFAGNAAIKAEAVCEATGLPALADDSGLEVDALDGEPGVLSARYAGEHGNDEANNDLLLSRMAGKDSRSANFRCALALKIPGRDTLIAEGRCPGTILYERRGTGGFGYDPLFLYEPMGKTYAEMNDEEKNRISHRARAAEKMREIMKNL